MAAVRTLQLLVVLVTAAASIASAAHVAPIYNGSTPQIKASTIPGIAYNGGPVMTSPIKLYFIWYGTSDFTATQKAILRGVATSFSPSSDGANTVQKWWGIDREYYDSANNHVSAIVTLAGEFVDSAASQGTSLTCSGTTTNKVFDVVKHAITGGLPVDSTALYVVFSNTGISQTGTPGCDNTAGNLCSDGFCSAYCGWHDYISYSGSVLKYAFIGNPSSCLNGCAPPSNQAGSPNNDLAIDAMVSTFSHELAEAASDPDLDAWTDANGENADKCAYTYGTTFTSTTGGGSYNLVGANGKQYMIQQNWDITTGGCRATSAVSYTTPAPTAAGTPAPPSPTTKAPTPAPTTAGTPAPPTNAPTPGPTPAAGTPALLINEFWYDQPSYDYAEFVELKNTGASAIQLSGYTLTLYGSTDASYNSITLPSYSLPAGGYYVVCCPAYKTSLNTFTATTSCQLSWTSDQSCTGSTTGQCNLIRNTEYASIVLSAPGGATVDSVSWGSTSTLGSPTWTEPRGSGGANYVTGSGSGGNTNARCPDGKYTSPNGNNKADFSSVAAPTPGASNTGHC